MPCDSLSGKRVLVLDGTKGLGFNVASLASIEGAEICLASGDQASLDVAVRNLGPRARGYRVDLANASQTNTFFAALGPIDHLVLAPGPWSSTIGGSLSASELLVANAILTVRLWAELAAVTGVGRQMPEHASITLTDGVNAMRPWEGDELNLAMLEAMIRLTERISQDLTPIRVNAVCAGLVFDRPFSAKLAGLAGGRAVETIVAAKDSDGIAKAYLRLMRDRALEARVLILNPQ